MANMPRRVWAGPFVIVFWLMGCGAADVVAGDSTETPSPEPAAVASAGALTWQTLTGPAVLHVDGARKGDVFGAPECLDDECQDPVEVFGAARVIAEVGSIIEFEVETAMALREPVVLRLNDAFRFVEVAPPADGAIEFDETGLYFIEAAADVVLGDQRGVTHFFVWTRVVDGSAGCETGGGTNATLTGVIDESGCPATDASLDFDALHSSFHCGGWPATLELASGDRYVRRAVNDPAGVDVLAEPPTDLESSGVFVESGEVFRSPSDADAVFVAREDGSVTRWPLDTAGEGCA